MDSNKEVDFGGKGVPLISVIVPIYNVEKYVRKCLDSLKNQTMKQIEVICIDDGSTDGSGEIAEGLKNEKGWPIFRIIHTENHGLSAARNRGVDEARSEWLMFVDSDDWVEELFCEIPFKAALDNKADLVIFQADYRKKDRVMKCKKKDFPNGIVDEFTAHEFGAVAAWGKLYRKKLFRNIRYPVGRAYEDFATTHKLVHKAETIVSLDDTLYHYIFRKGSITQTTNYKNKKDEFLSFLERNNALVSYGFPSEKLKNQLLSKAISYLSFSFIEDDEVYQYATSLLECQNSINENLPTKQKIALTIYKINPKMLRLLTRILKNS